MQPDARHPLPSLLLMVMLACGPVDPDPTTAGQGADAGSTSATCPQPSQQPDGSCCPMGAVFHAESASCVAVGPSDCAAVALTSPAQCIPRWCWDLRSEEDEPCAAPGPLCRAVGRLCNAAERASGAGCPAGEVPNDLDVCVPAGLLSTAPLLGGAHDPTVTPLPPPALPPLQPPHWCLEGANTYACTKAEGGCPVGELPDLNGACLAAGVDWICPPGFLVDKDAPATAARPAGCLPDPADCGAGPWPADLPDKGVLYVNPAAKAGGDGSKAAPFVTLKAAVNAAPVGSVLALSAGTWTEPLSLHKGLQVRGRCAALTRLANPSAPANVLIDGKGGPVSLRDVAVVGVGIGAIAVAPVEALLQRVHIRGATVAGVATLAKGARLTLIDVVVAATQPKGDATGGRGVEASAGGELSLQRVRISQQRDIGLMVAGAGSKATVDELLVADTRSLQLTGKRGRGVDVSAGALADLHAVRVVGSAEAGARVGGTGSRLVAHGLWVQGSLTPPEGPKGHGVIARDGAEMMLKGVRVDDATGHGVHITEAGTAAKIAGLRVSGTRPAAVLGHGQGVVAFDGGWLDMVGAHLSDNRQVGLAAGGAGTQVWARALLVEGTAAPSAEQLESVGVLASGGAQLELAEVRLHANHGMGLAVADPGSKATVSDLLADAGVSFANKSPSGMGVAVYLGARLNMQRARLSGNGHAGLMLQEPDTVAVVKDLVVDSSLPQAGTGEFGRGVVVLSGSRLELERARLTNNFDRGLSVEGTATMAAVSDVLIDNISSSAATGEGGNGVVVASGGRLQAGRMRLTGNRSAALLVDNPGSRLDLWGSLVDHTQGDQAKNASGTGLASVYGGQVALGGVVLSANRSAGIASAYQGAILQAVGCVIEDTGASTTELQNGIGAGGLLESTMGLQACVLRRNRVAGVFFSGGAGGVWDSVVSDTGVAAIIGSHGGEFEFGDGVLASQVSAVTVARSLLTNNQRAGLYVNYTDNVTISGVVATSNLFGLATSGSLVTLSAPGAMYNNSQANVAGEVTLGVPKSPDPGKL